MVLCGAGEFLCTFMCCYESLRGQQMFQKTKEVGFKPVVSSWLDIGTLWKYAVATLEKDGFV